MMRVVRSGIRGGARVAIAALMAGAVGCTGEIDPERVEARALAAGRFEVAEGGPRLVEAGTRIACAPGVVFGVDYRVEVESGGGGTLPISFWWIHPEFAIPSKKLWGRETAARAANPKLARGERVMDGRALWTLEDPDERVDGEYRFEIRRATEGAPILAVPFTVEGC